MWHKCKVKRKRREGFHCLCGGGGGGGAGDFEDFKLDKRVHTEEGKRREGFHCHFGWWWWWGIATFETLMCKSDR